MPHPPAYPSRYNGTGSVNWLANEREYDEELLNRLIPRPFAARRNRYVPTPPNHYLDSFSSVKLFLAWTLSDN
jgi:hypothetical protein